MSCQTYSTSMTALSRTCVGCSIGLRTARRPSTGYGSWLVSWRIARRSSLQVRPWRICPGGLGKHKSSAPVKERLQLDALSNTTMSPFLFHFVENSTAVWLGNQLIWVRSLIPPFLSCLRFGDSSRARRTGSADGVSWFSKISSIGLLPSDPRPRLRTPLDVQVVDEAEDSTVLLDPNPTLKDIFKDDDLRTLLLRLAGGQATLRENVQRSTKEVMIFLFAYGGCKKRLSGSFWTVVSSLAGSTTPTFSGTHSMRVRARLDFSE